MRDTFARRRGWLTAIAAAAMVCYAAVAGTFRTFSRPAEIATFLPGAIALTFAATRGRPAPARPARRFGLWLWALLALAALAVEVPTWAIGGGHAHPTASDLINPLLSTDLGRAVGFALWLAGGVWLLRRGTES